MTLPVSGAISMNDVNVELGNAGTDTISLNDSAVRTLFEIASGAISLDDGHGKSNFTCDTYDLYDEDCHGYVEGYYWDCSSGSQTYFYDWGSCYGYVSTHCTRSSDGMAMLTGAAYYQNSSC